MKEEIPKQIPKKIGHCLKPNKTECDHFNQHKENIFEALSHHLCFL